MTENVKLVSKYLPSLLEVKNNDLAEKIANVWIKIFKMSKWGDIGDAAVAEGVKDQSLVAHVNAIIDSSLAVARIIKKYQAIEFDEQRIIVLGLLHDVDKMILNEPDENGIPVEAPDKHYKDVNGVFCPMIQHGVLTAMIAREEGISEEYQHLILTHTPTQNYKPAYIEGYLCEVIDVCNYKLVVRCCK